MKSLNSKVVMGNLSIMITCMTLLPMPPWATSQQSSVVRGPMLSVITLQGNTEVTVYTHLF